MAAIASTYAITEGACGNTRPAQLFGYRGV
jgi:hypothetical protein